MKTKITILAILLLAIVYNSYATQQVNNENPTSLSGTWRLVQVGNQLQQQVIPDDIPIRFLKKFNDTHFTTITFSTDGQIGRINGGTYTLDGNVYIENIEYSVPDINAVNTQAVFAIEFRGNDEFQMSGTLSNGLSLVEVWRRVDNETATQSATTANENRTTKPIPLKDENGIFFAPEQLPQFPGGTEAMMKFLSENVSHPTTPHLQGNVIASFVVTETGQIVNIRIVRSLSPEYDKEVMRVIQSMPNWIPGTHEGVPVPTFLNIPITFR